LAAQPPESHRSGYTRIRDEALPSLSPLCDILGEVQCLLVLPIWAPCSASGPHPTSDKVGAEAMSGA